MIDFMLDFLIVFSIKFLRDFLIFAEEKYIIIVTPIRTSKGARDWRGVGAIGVSLGII